NTSVIITQPTVITSSISSQVNVSCNGGADGSASITASGGTPAYSYEWTGGQTNSSATNFSAGIYYVTITDLNNCTLEDTVTITEPAVINVNNTTQTNVSCFGGNNGSVTVIASGGVPNYTYTWSNGATGATASGLTAGIYTVTVSDANLCTQTFGVTITEPTALTGATLVTNETVFNACDGTATITGSDGTPLYSYVWSDLSAQTTQTANNLCVGNYTVTLSDANGCTYITTVTISGPDALILTPTGSAVNCNGDCDGTTTVAVSGGIAPYDYLWDATAGNQITQTATGLCAGIYSVTVTDQNGATGTTTATVTQPTAMSASIPVSVQPSCFGGTNGNATVSATGGTLPYSYVWGTTPSQTTASATNLSAGTYSVTITDALGCTTTASQILGEPTQIIINISGTDVLCNGNADGSADLTASGGTGILSFSWSNTASSEDISNLAAGNYIVTVTDANGCTQNENITINEPVVLTATIGNTSETVFGACDGTATVTPIGGTGIYSYLWDNPAPAQTTQAASNLCPGTYTVTVTDQNGCIFVIPTTVLGPDALVLTVTGSAVDCNGDCDGTASVSVTGGIPPYNFAWDVNAGSQTNDTAVGLCAGSYSVTVTDSNGAIASILSTVTEPTLLTSSIIDQDNTLCFGSADGSASAQASNGTLPYTYNWSNSTSGANATGLIAGTYDVTVIDGNGCISVSSVTITSPTQVIVSASGTDVACFNGTDGSVLATPSEGTPGYSFEWSNGSANSSVSNLPEGTYSVTVTDINNCTATTSVTISQPVLLDISILATTDPSGFGASDGSATAGATGGATPYTWSWSNGTTSDVATGLSSGTYTVTVTDANGCTATTSATIFEPGALQIQLISSTNISCNGVCDGTAEISVSGGVPGYTYLWGNGVVTPDVTGLCAGSNTVTVTDQNGYSATYSVNLTEPALLSATTLVISNVLCNGGTSGSAWVTATGGTTPYSYLWSNTATNDTITLLAAGGYSVVITDSHNCQYTSNVSISEPTTLVVTTTSIDANCNQAQGSISAVVTGGTAPYTYLWNISPQPGIQTVSNLVPGTYSTTVTDVNNCTSTATGIINNIPGVTLIIKGLTDALCNGSCDGIAIIESSGGGTPYTYTCSNGYTTTNASNTIDINGLCAGNYSATVTDGNSCQASVTFTINEPLPVIATILDSVHVSCDNGSDGSATVSGSGGTVPFTAIWNTIPSQTDVIATGLIAGNYSVTITDVNGCSDDISVVITQPSPIIVSTTFNNAHCGQADGSASVTATGGTISTGYSYLWSGGTMPLNLSTISGLSSALSPYTVTVTDNNNCTATANVSVGDIPPGTASISSFTNVSCNGAADGSATVSMGGGQSPYQYLWSTVPSQTTLTATNLAPGTYTVSVTDAFNCIVTASVSITEPAVLSNIFTVQNPLCYNACTGSIASLISGGTTPYQYIWSNVQTSSTISALCAESYSLTVTDANNCSAEFSSTLTQPSQIIITGTASDAACNNADGSVDITVTGGSPAYQFLWSNSSTNQNINAVAAGTYTIMVTDAEGCTASQAFNVNNISGPAITLTGQTNITCFGSNNGTASISVTGGTLMFTYQWNTTPAQYTASATNLEPGIHSVTVTDVNTNCNANLSVTITEPAALNAIQSVIEPLCNGDCNGSAAALVTGGTAPYNYQWFGGGSSVTSATNTDLCAGNYSLVVSDANACTGMYTVTVNQPTFVTAVTSSTSMTCNSVCDGTATVIPSGGTSPYSYSWQPGNQTTQTAVGLCSGTHSVTVSDAHGCDVLSTVNVTAPPPLLIFLIDLQHVKCFGQSSGRIIVSVSGGTPNHSYSWSNGATTQNLIGIPFGNYCLTVTDQNGCSKDTCFIVSQPPLLQVSLNHTDESCYGFCDGTATPNIQGGQQPYTYLWSNFTTNSTANNLCPGLYNLTVTDLNNCTASANTNIVGYDILSLLLVHVDTATCGQPNGAAQISVIGGSSNYDYSWPAGVSSNSPAASGLLAGSYTVTVTDDNNCTATLDININNADGPIINNIIPTNVSCYNAQNGSLLVNFTSSTTYNTITWNTTPVQNGATAVNLGPGMYSVVITDDHGCTSSQNASITQPQQLLSAVTNHTDVSCFGYCNGSATVLSSGGIDPHQYLWSNALTSYSVNGLCAGNYSVTTTDNNGCTSISTIVIDQPDSLEINSTINSVTCNGLQNGQIIVQASGGTGYFYNWFPNVSSNSVAANLAPGEYTLVLTDYYDLNCSVTETFTVTEPYPIFANTNSTPTTCGLNNGMAYIYGEITGGVHPFTISWSPGNYSGDTIYNAAAGTYQLQITDENNCSEVFPVPVSSVTPPVLDYVSTENASCPGFSDGTATIGVKFGTSPFTYTWTPFIGSDSVINALTANLNDLQAGIYNVTISDINGCNVQTTFIVDEPDPIHVFADGGQWICVGQSVTISANASGGQFPYLFSWNTLPSNNPVQYVNPTVTSTYQVFATDQNLCQSDTAEVTVNVYPLVTVQLFKDTSICKGMEATLYAIPSGGNGGPYNYYWYENGTSSGLSPNDEFTVSPLVTTEYMVEATDNCSPVSDKDSVVVTIIPIPNANIIASPVSGCEPLSVDFQNIDTTGNVTYLWNFNDPYSNNNITIDQNPSHTYTDNGVFTVSLTLTTPEGCTAIANRQINVFPVPNAEFHAFPEVVSLFHSTVEFTDISGDVSWWSWNFGDNHFSSLTNPEHSYQEAGIFQVQLIVKNSYGCKDSVTHDIEVREETTFYAPTAFDPNSPRNNKWKPTGVGIDESKYYVYIFDRWGQIVFETSDFNEAWDGRFFNSGTDYVKSGSYIWHVRFRDVNGKWIEKTGSVTVIR
ncbi:MAG: hypothetical protein A2275_16500, partial [Bacteroidetes bacterium RIFOXYA12_FULL_35_11]